MGGSLVQTPPLPRRAGGDSLPPQLPPCRGCTISAEGGTRGGVVNFKVLEDSDDSPPVGGGVRGGVGSLRGDKGGVVSRQDPVGGTLPLREGDFALQN